MTSIIIGHNMSCGAQKSLEFVTVTIFSFSIISLKKKHVRYKDECDVFNIRSGIC